MEVGRPAKLLRVWLALALVGGGVAQGQSSGGWVPAVPRGWQSSRAPEARPVESAVALQSVAPAAPAEALPAQEPIPEPTPPAPLTQVGTPAAGEPDFTTASTQCWLSPSCPLERLPCIAPDPPVPYYSDYCGAAEIEPSGPLLELPGVKLGWLFSAEVSYIQPFVHNGLNSGVGALGAIPENVNVPQARANGTASPRIDVAYRFEDGLGEFHAIFRTLNDTTTRTIAGFDTAGSGTVTSRLNMNVLDLEYGFMEFNPGRVPRLNPLLLIRADWAWAFIRKMNSRRR